MSEVLLSRFRASFAVVVMSLRGGRGEGFVMNDPLPGEVANNLFVVHLEKKRFLI